MIPTHKKLTGALIGAGFFAGFQAEAWLRMKEVVIAAVVDPVPGKAAAFAAKHGIHRSYTTAEMLFHHEQLDFVDIATRPDTHLLLVRLAAQHGAHVICQKPMAPAMADCIAMCETTDAAGVRLIIHENWRWQPWYREALRLIQSRAIGSLRHLSFDWRSGDGNGPQPYADQPYFREMPRLIIYESLVHILDTFRCLAGELSITACKIRRINPIIAGEDWAELEVRFANGATGFIHGDRHTGPVPSPAAMGSMIIEGECGTLRISPAGDLYLHEQRLHFTPSPLGYKGDSVLATQQHFITSLRTGEPGESEGRSYLRTVRLVEDAYQMANQ